MKTLILGLGNPILCDDGVGLHVARALENLVPDSTVVTTTMIDLQLLETMSDYERLFVVDALHSHDDDIGMVKKLPPEHETLHLFSSHGLHFFELMELGRQLGYILPEISGIYGIVIEPENSFGSSFSPLITMKLESIISEIVADIKISCNS